jgi:hypothetical protein
MKKTKRVLLPNNKKEGLGGGGQEVEKRRERESGWLCGQDNHLRAAG